MLCIIIVHFSYPDKQKTLTLKALNPDPQARLYLDSNGTLLTPAYVDELVLEAGVTDIGIEPKAVQVATFQHITGIADAALAERYLETAWQAVEYVAATYAERVFLGVGMPYNQELVGPDEVEAFGELHYDVSAL